MMNHLHRGKKKKDRPSKKEANGNGSQETEGKEGGVNHALLVQNASTNQNAEEGVGTTLLQKVGCRRFLKDRGYWDPLMYMITFIIHFVTVILILTGGAVVFAYLEDREFLVESRDLNNQSMTPMTSSNVSAGEVFEEVLWNEMEEKFNMSVDTEFRQSLLQHFRNYVTDEQRRQKETSRRRQHADKMFIICKWIYFVTITTTTIGYGDLSPKTDDGKLFYIPFSILGIILMMTLLRRCGTVISAANRMVYKLIDTYLCRNKTGELGTSHAVLSLVTILLIFFAYFFAGFWYAKENLSSHWSLLEQLYFWTVTLTTVGFGDLTLPVEEEVENFTFYLLYRVFGLAILAAIIDAIQEVVKAFDEKRLALKKKLSKLGNVVKSQVEGLN